MSIMPMRKVTLVGLKSDQQNLISALQQAGVLHICSLKNNNFNFIHQEIMREQEKIHSLEKAISYLKKFQANAQAIPVKCKNGAEAHDQVSQLISKYSQFCDQKIYLEKLIMRFENFGEFKNNLTEIKKHNILLKLACLDNIQINYLRNKKISFKIVKKIEEKNYTAILLHNQKLENITLLDPPDKSLSNYRQEILSLDQKILDLEKELSRWSYQLRSLEKLKTESLLNFDRLQETKKIQENNNLFGISGYILAKQVDILKKVLLNFVVATRIEAPHAQENVPVKLRNPRIFAGFEAIIRAFTGINYFEKDKTCLVFLLFMFFGSLCLLDAGYGFLLFILGYVVNIKKNKQFGQVFMWTGAFATILGLLCGQVFGLIFAKDILFNFPPIFTIATDPLACFYFSLLVGLGAMALTNCVNIFQEGLKTNSLGNFFAILLISLYITSQSETFKNLPNFNILIYILLGLTLFSWLLFPEPVFGQQNRLANILWTLYSGPVGLIQDILSHMRLFGIALSGAILALVVNKIAGMMPMVFGAIFASAGHFFVFLLALLSLYIHTNRLIFLEFGSKCMKGGNNYFQPFARRYFL